MVEQTAVNRKAGSSSLSSGANALVAQWMSRTLLTSRLRVRVPPREP